MAYDEGVARRLRKMLAQRDDVEERRMFGGLAFMVAGHMCCGVLGDKLMARVGPAEYDRRLAQPYACKMDISGKPLTGFVSVAAPGFETDEDLRAWLQSCLQFVQSLPAK